MGVSSRPSRSSLSIARCRSAYSDGKAVLTAAKLISNVSYNSSVPDPQVSEDVMECQERQEGKEATHEWSKEPY